MNDKRQVQKLKGKQQQQGAVMVIVMMMLVVITLMGVGSLRQGMLQAQMGAGEVAYDVCFHAAEAGLTAVYLHYQDEPVPISDPANFMNAATGTKQFHCLNNGGIEDLTGSTCGGNLSEYANVAVTMVSRPADPDNKYEQNFKPGFLNDIDRGGSFLIFTDARCELGGLDMSVTNTQTWSHRKSTSIGNLEFTGS